MRFFLQKTRPELKLKYQKRELLSELLIKKFADKKMSIYSKLTMILLGKHQVLFGKTTINSYNFIYS